MHGSNSKKTLGTVTILFALTLSACSGGGDGATSTSSAGSASSTGNTGTTNTTVAVPAVAPLSISGAPNRQAVANQPYWFRPVANNTNGAAVQFGISNKPNWCL